MIYIYREGGGGVSKREGWSEEERERRQANTIFSTTTHRRREDKSSLKALWTPSPHAHPLHRLIHFFTRYSNLWTDEYKSRLASPLSKYSPSVILVCHSTPAYRMCRAKTCIFNHATNRVLGRFTRYVYLCSSSTPPTLFYRLLLSLGARVGMQEQFNA